MFNKGIIDRFEGDYAIVEGDDGIFHRIEKYRLPFTSYESSVISYNGCGMYKILEDETRALKAEVRKLMNELYGED